MSPVRALLAAQAQSLGNRLTSESQVAGPAAALVTVAIVGFCLFWPAVLAFALGQAWATDCREEAPAAAAVRGMGAALVLVVVGLGVIGGALGGGQRLDGAALRTFPVRPRQLLAAEIVASALDHVPLLALALCGGLAAGLAHAEPRLTLPAALLAVEAVATVTVLQHLSGSARRVVLRAPPRLTLSALVVLTVLASALSLWPIADPLRLSPFQPAIVGIAELARGSSPRAVGLQALTLAILLVLLPAVAWIDRRARSFERQLAAGARAPRRIWSFRHPVTGLARLHCIHVLGSSSGRTLLALPLVVGACGAVMFAFIRRAAAGEAHPPALLTLPLAALFPVLGVLLTSELALNQFGRDGSGIKMLFLLPLPAQTLLLGRALAQWCLQAAAVAVGVLPLLLVRPTTPGELVWGVGAGGATMVLLTAMGHGVSALLPHRSGDGGGGRTPLAAFVMPWLATSVALLPVVVVHGMYAGWPEMRPYAMLLLLVISGFVYDALLPRLARFVSRRRERVVEAVGR